MFTTLGELRSQLRTVLGLPDGGVDDSELNSYINQVYRGHLPQDLMPHELRQQFIRDTSSGVGEYGLDRDIMSVVGPSWIADSELFVTRDDTWFFSFAKSRYDEKYGKPTRALLFGNLLWMYPVPDAAYILRTTALARPEKLENDDDAVLNTAWAFPIIYGAAGLFSIDRGDTGASQQHFAMYQNTLAGARQEMLVGYTHRRAVSRW